jgi:hypothetical protein
VDTIWSTSWRFWLNNAVHRQLFFFIEREWIDLYILPTQTVGSFKC